MAQNYRNTHRRVSLMSPFMQLQGANIEIAIFESQQYSLSYHKMWCIFPQTHICGWVFARVILWGIGKSESRLSRELGSASKHFQIDTMIRIGCKKSIKIAVASQPIAMNGHEVAGALVGALSARGNRNKGVKRHTLHMQKKPATTGETFIIYFSSQKTVNYTTNLIENFSPTWKWKLNSRIFFPYTRRWTGRRNSYFIIHL